MRWLPFVALAVTACRSSAPARPTSTDPVRRVETGLVAGARIRGLPGLALADRMRHYTVPGVSIAVIANHQLAWAKGYGLADGATAVDPHTLFQAASVSKPVTAMAALRLGHVALDANIDASLRSWQVPQNKYTKLAPVTLSLLLSHQAGINVHGFMGYEAGDPLPTLLQILDGAAPAISEPIRVTDTPGNHVHYSGGGFEIVQQALMDVEQQPFEELMQRAVLRPVGMTDSTFGQPLPATRSAATGHDAVGHEVPGRRYVYPELAAAGLWSTPTDLARFLLALDPRMLQKQQSLDHGYDMGLGILLHRLGAETYVEHGGVNLGFQSSIVLNPKRGYGAVVMANGDRGGKLIDEIVASIAATYGWAGYPAEVAVVEVDPARLERLAGSYRVSSDCIWRITAEDQRLVLRTAFADDQVLVPISEHEFVSTTSTDRFEWSEWGLTVGDRTFVTETGARAPLDDLAEGKVQLALVAYRAALAVNDPVITEDHLNQIGIDQFLSRGQLQAALTVLGANVQLFPYSLQTYDLLAEVQLRAGQRAAAIATQRAALAAVAQDPARDAAAKENATRVLKAKLEKLERTPQTW